MPKKITTICLLISLFLSIQVASAEISLAQRLSGRILLQTQANGEAWYINPTELKRYYLGKPDDAFEVMKKLGLGITNNNLNKIPVSLDYISGLDSDNDGLPNSLEDAIGTNSNLSDSDGDSYGDQTEIYNNYNPLGAGKLNLDLNLAKKNAGKILLQVESKGEAWYINPLDMRRYFLGRPTDAFALMRRLGLGITDSNLELIPIGHLTDLINTPDQVIQGAAKAIIAGNNSEAVKFFIPQIENAVNHTINFLGSDERFSLGNLMLGAKLSSSNEKKYTYLTEVYFSLNGSKNKVYFYVEKQTDGSWKLTNL
jgi:hypothetical protein